MKRNTPWRLVNEVTGESLSAEVRESAEPSGGGWLKVYQRAALDLLTRHPELTGESLRVFLILIGHAAWNNALPSPTVLAERTGMKRSNLARAYSKLLRSEFLIKRERTYYLSPVLCWKGTERQLDWAMRQYFEEQQPPAFGLQAVK